jgi:hypothetical protein
MSSCTSVYQWLSLAFQIATPLIIAVAHFINVRLAELRHSKVVAKLDVVTSNQASELGDRAPRLSHSLHRGLGEGPAHA